MKYFHRRSREDSNKGPGCTKVPGLHIKISNCDTIKNFDRICIQTLETSECCELVDVQPKRFGQDGEEGLVRKGDGRREVRVTQWEWLQLGKMPTFN